MTNCEDIFNQIRNLQQKRDTLLGEAERLDSIDPDDMGVGKSEEDIVRRSLGEDPEVNANAEGDVIKGTRSNRAKETFNNAEAVVKRVGEDQAFALLQLVRGIDASWKQMSPVDFAEQVKSFSRADLEAEVEKALNTVGIKNDTKIVNEVFRNVAPFVPILKNQARLTAFNDIAFAKYIRATDELIELLEAGDYSARELQFVKRKIVEATYTSVIAQRGRNIARTRSGQLLRNTQDLMIPREVDVDALPDAKPVDPDAPKKTEAKPKRVLSDEEKAMNAATYQLKKLREEVEEIMNMIVNQDVPDLAQGTQLNRIIEAADKGIDGVPELKLIRKQMAQARKDGEGSIFSDGYDYEKFAAAAWKDTVLGGLKSVGQNNWANQRMVFYAEGYMQAFGNIPVAYRNLRQSPYATSVYRDAWSATVQGVSSAWNANWIAENVIKRDLSDKLADVMRDDLPFSGNKDRVNRASGQLSIADQKELAVKILERGIWKRRWWNAGGMLSPRRMRPGSPIPDFNPAAQALHFRDQINWGAKLYANHFVTNKAASKIAGEPTEVPVLSVLQLNNAIDNQAGIRTFMADRANQLELEYYANTPGGTIAGAVEYSKSKVADELYSMRPTAEQIQSYRDQYGITKDMSPDEDIRLAIVATKVGQPRLDTPSRIRSFDKSKEFRMQGDTADEVPILGDVNRILSRARGESRQVDFFVPFLKSWAEQTAWDLGTGGLTTLRSIADVADIKVRGGVNAEVPVELYGKLAGSATMWASLVILYNAMEAGGDDAPFQLVGTALTSAEREALRNQGKLPNHIHFKYAPEPIRNLPIGNMPLIKTLLLYKDLSTAWQKGVVSDADWKAKSSAILAVGAGLLLRAPGLQQLQWLLRALTGITDDEDGTTLEKVGGELAARYALAPSPGQSVSRTVNQYVMDPFTRNDWSTLINTSNVMAREADVIAQLPDDHPLKSNQQAVINFLANGGSPELARLVGGRDRKYTYLGQKINSFRYLSPQDAADYPNGIPQLKTDGGNWLVEGELDRLGKHKEPGVFRSMVLAGIPITPTGINDLELISGTMLGGPYTGELRIGGGEFIRENGTIGNRKGLSMKALMNRLVRGNTWRQALNALFTSPEYERWNSNPETTNQGNMSRTERDLRPGNVLVDEINRYYTQLLPIKFEEAGANDPERFQGAAQYLEDKRTLTPTLEEVNENFTTTRDVTIGLPAAQ